MARVPSQLGLACCNTRLLEVSVYIQLGQEIEAVLLHEVVERYLFYVAYIAETMVN